jgi:uncharacterized protein YllA (UPF0747 family)
MQNVEVVAMTEDTREETLEQQLIEAFIEDLEIIVERIRNIKKSMDSLAKYLDERLELYKEDLHT